MISKTTFVEEGTKPQKESHLEEIDFPKSTAQVQNDAELEVQKYSWQDFREDTNIFCNLSFRIFYICCGVLQFFAILAGFEYIFPNHDLIPVAISFPLAFLPLAGTIFGILGAHIAWGWYLSHAIAIFTIPYFIVIAPMNFIAFVEFCTDIMRWNSEKHFSDETPKKL